VLSEGDDLQDPIADASRAILDGHIVLSRALADAGHFPAIDIEKSISRVMPAVTSDQHQLMARSIKQLYASYQQSKDLIAIGAYVRGSDPQLDLAINMLPRINQFLQQSMKDIVPYDECLTLLSQLAPQPKRANA
jgi:flagellum-specific ATP synthase